MTRPELESTSGPNQISAIREICRLFDKDELDSARRMARRDLPLAPATPARRNPSRSTLAKLWKRDGFVDQYTGQRLVYPGALRLLSALMPDELPYHPRWKIGSC